MSPLTEWLLLLAGWAVALAFRPWQIWQHRPLQNVWLATLVILPWLWWTQKLLPSGMALHLSGACLMVLMLGWPMAVLMALPIGVSAALIDIYGPQHLSRAALTQPLPPVPDWADAGTLLVDRLPALGAQMFWMDLLPATLALGMGLMLRRWAPKHLFVYILGRAFIITALAITFTGVLGWLAGRVPATIEVSDWVLGHWLLGWGEAFTTGMLVAIFVAFKPHWLLTYSDERYLPGAPQQGKPPPPP
jgi:uncharacterized membrane protein